jgi:hypothetical protein
MVTSAIGAGRADRKTRVPWSGFDLINAFNAWKKSDDAGRVFAVDSIGHATNLANWGRAHFNSSPIPDRQAAGRVNNAR